MTIGHEQIIMRSVQLAEGVGGAPSPMVDRTITAEAAFPHAVRAVYRQSARNGRNLNNLRLPYPIRITDGKGTLPDGILREFLDRSHIRRDQFGSMLPPEDFNRYKFGEQMNYYSVDGDEVSYAGDLPAKLTLTPCTATTGSNIITGPAMGAKVGDRFKLEDAENGLVIESFIEAIADSTFTVRGKALVSTTDTRVGVLYNGQDDLAEPTSEEGNWNTPPDREVTDAVTVINTRTVSSASAAFTDDDINKRLKIVNPDTDAIVLDSIIDSITNATTVDLRAKALATGTGLTATFMYSPLVITAIGIPEVEACGAINGFSLGVAEDVIVMLAQVLRGELKMQELIEAGNGTES